MRGLGCPVRIVLSAGQASDAPRAHRADHVREAVAAKGAEAVIPSNPAHARRLPLDEHLYGVTRRMPHWPPSKPMGNMLRKR